MERPRIIGGNRHEEQVRQAFGKLPPPVRDYVWVTDRLAQEGIPPHQLPELHVRQKALLDCICADGTLITSLTQFLEMKNKPIIERARQRSRR